MQDNETSNELLNGFKSYVLKFHKSAFSVKVFFINFKYEIYYTENWILVIVFNKIISVTLV